MKALNKIQEAYEEVMLNEATRGEIILKSKVIATFEGNISTHPYRAVMWQKSGKWMIGIDQSFEGKFTKYSRVGAGWGLSTLIEEPISDFIWIDHGQKWGVKGMRGVIKEALTHI